MWDAQRFALALAQLIETGDATDAHLMVEAAVVSTCRKYRMGDDACDVLQSTWVNILAKAQHHETSPSIAKQIPAIVRNEAVSLIRKRQSVRKLVLTPGEN